MSTCSWDEAYEREINNNVANAEDEGTIWFEDSGAEEKMIAYLEDLDIGGGDGEDNADRNDLKILDLGTGNGHLLFALKDDGWQAHMVGVDYSTPSINLAKQIQQTRSGESTAITFEQWDIIKEAPGAWLDGGFHVVLDKGTFDAISLSDESHEGGRRGCELYASKIEPLIKIGGYFLITSCNWTADELRKWFSSPGLVYHDNVRYASYTFGGVQGQTVSTLCFRREELSR